MAPHGGTSVGLVGMAGVQRRLGKYWGPTQTFGLRDACWGQGSCSNKLPRGLWGTLKSENQCCRRWGVMKRFRISLAGAGWFS